MCVYIEYTRLLKIFYLSFWKCWVLLKYYKNKHKRILWWIWECLQMDNYHYVTGWPCGWGGGGRRFVRGRGRRIRAGGGWGGRFACVCDVYKQMCIHVYTYCMYFNPKTAQ
jgi:hypothetical protein